MRVRATVLAVLALAAAAPAEADTVSFTLQGATQTATTKGGALSFTATVSAPITNTGLEYLNGLNDNISPTNGFTLDADPFLNNFPFFLAPGDSFTGELFTLLVPANSAAGLYTGSIVLLGGASDASQNSLATQAFAVNVTPAVAAAPEPASWALMILGAGIAGSALRRRRVATVRVRYAA